MFKDCSTDRRSGYDIVAGGRGVMQTHVSVKYVYLHVFDKCVAG